MVVRYRTAYRNRAKVPITHQKTAGKRELERLPALTELSHKSRYVYHDRPHAFFKMQNMEIIYRSPKSFQERLRWVQGDGQGKKGR